MSALVEKILLIGFGSVIVLSLFSFIIPILQNFDTIERESSIQKFNNLILSISGGEQQCRSNPGNDLCIEFNFSLDETLGLYSTSDFSVLIQLSLGEIVEFSEVVTFSEFIDLHCPNEYSNGLIYMNYNSGLLWIRVECIE